MKKNLLNVGLFLLSLFAVSCTMQDPVEEKKLGVEAKGPDIVIAVPADKDAKYINIYRKKKDSEYVYNIGEILPGEQDSSASYVFTDGFVDFAVSYSYCARYTYKDYYKTTGWSEPININDDTGPGELRVASSDVALKFNKDENIIEFITGSYDFPKNVTDTTGWSISMIVKNDSKSRVFKITNSKLETKIDLRSVLSSEFLKSSFTIKNFVLEKIEDKSKTSDYKVIYWSLPLDDEPVIEGTENNLITLDTSNLDDNNHDYSKTDGSLYALIKE